CWHYNSNLRPTIQCVFKDLNNIDYNDLFDVKEIFTGNNMNIECNKLSLEPKSLNTTDLMKHCTDLYNETAKELELISSAISSLKEANQTSTFYLNSALNIIPKASLSSNPTSYENVFLYNLNQLLITQFDIQGVSKNSTCFIIYHIKKYIENNNKNPHEIFNQYNNHKDRSYFTSIIGFFHEHGIGTTVNYCEAFNMYEEASKDLCPTNFVNQHEHFLLSNNLLRENLLKENQLVGLISLGLLYIDGRGVMINRKKAYQLFLRSAIRGSSLGKYYV
ncbi:29273_t:CDS:1, partial [Racocetra persica]